MAELPFMPLYTDALLGDTMHLDAVEFGAYCLILFTMWRNGGSLPDDDARLAKVARVNPSQWRKIGPVVRQFLTPAEDGKLTQKRLQNEFAHRTERSAINSRNGKRGAAANALKRQQPPLANAGVLLEQTGSERASEPAANGSAKRQHTRIQNPEAVAAYVEGSNSARAREAPDDPALRARIAIRGVFERHGYLPDRIPETGHAETWLKAGYDLAMIERVVSEGLARNGKVRSLRYFDDAIREAHERRPPVEPAGDPWQRIPRESYPLMLKIWRDNPDRWDRSTWGPRPNERGCVIPAELLNGAAP